jgi:adenylate cyclase
MAGLTSSLRARGIPLWRCSFSLMTKHPELVWRRVQWEDGSGVKTVDYPRGTLGDAYFTDSPVALLRGGSLPIRVRLTEDDVRFPICRDLKARGATDYFAQALPASNGEVSYVSWATRAEGGFDDDTLAALTELGPQLAQRVELESAYHATRALLEVYLGRNAGQRVARGDFRRGTGELIDAAIWFCDLRNYTAFSDRSAPQSVVQTLDEYFERVAGSILDSGGEVLKFVGDAILAIFPVANGGAAVACRCALEAAEHALEAIEFLNVERSARADEAIDIGIALHVGRVMYGNIGARDRLDFTVISASVNEACRLEGLCKPLRTPLAMSEAFVAAATPEHAVNLGRHALKGVREPITVFGLARFLLDAPAVNPIE